MPEREHDRFGLRVSRILFGADPAQVSGEQVRDVVGELTNDVGGDVEALLPQPSRLSLPSVTDATTQAPPGHDRGDDLLRVRVIERRRARVG